jgi:hypothetical protein
VQAPEAGDEIPRVEDTPSPDAPKFESKTDEPQILSVTKSSPNPTKAPSPQKASPSKVTPSLNPFGNPQSSFPAESPKNTPQSPRSHGLSSAGEAPLGGDFAQSQSESLPRQTPLVAETLAKDPDFIKAEFHIDRFITAVVDT